MTTPRPWLVMKFGGTSVATAERWSTIADRVEAAMSTHRVCVVASALSQVSNLLQRALQEALAGSPASAHSEIRSRHRALADDLDLDLSERGPVVHLLDKLCRLL
ncbi:MAG: hypothetical protein AAFZ18_29805 [Myxococcota bacterium]